MPMMHTFFSGFIRLLAALLMALVGATGAFCAQQGGTSNWVIGVLDSNMPQMQWVIRDSFHKIDPIYPKKRLVVRQLPVEAIYEAVRTQSLDFVCASPQVISVLERYYGYELLASLYQKKIRIFFRKRRPLFLRDKVLMPGQICAARPSVLSNTIFRIRNSCFSMNCTRENSRPTAFGKKNGFRRSIRELINCVPGRLMRWPFRRVCIGKPRPMFFRIFASFRGARTAIRKRSLRIRRVFSRAGLLPRAFA